MAAPTNIRTQGSPVYRTDVLVAAGAVISEGSIVGRSAAGFGIPATDTAGQETFGIAEADADNTGGANGAISVPTLSEGIFRLAQDGSFTQAEVGDTVFVSDEHTVQDLAGATNDVAVGRATAIEGTAWAWVHVNGGGGA